MAQLDPIHRGDGRQLSVALTLDGTPWTVPNGADVRCTAKRRRTDTDADAVFQKTLGDGITAAGAVLTVTIDPADTDELDRDTVLEVDVQVTPDGGVPLTVADFQLQVQLDVTRTTPGGD